MPGCNLRQTPSGSRLCTSEKTLSFYEIMLPFWAMLASVLCVNFSDHFCFLCRTFVTCFVPDEQCFFNAKVGAHRKRQYNQFFSEAVQSLRAFFWFGSRHTSFSKSSRRQMNSSMLPFCQVFNFARKPPSPQLR